MALPEASVTPVVIVAVYTVLPVSAVEGVKVAVVPEYDTLPATELLPCFSVKEVVVIVDEFMFSLKVAVTLLLVATEAAPLAGTTVWTVGGVTSACAEVVKFQL
jgi:hypothetical protein